MKQNYLFVDVQGFKDCKNNFILKELALATQEYTQVFLIKPPHAYCNLTREEKTRVNWIEKKKGIFWKDGYIDYREFRRVIIQYLENKNIIVKGAEKVKWVKELCSNCDVIDIGDKGCPNLVQLTTKYCKDYTLFNCVYHEKQCALKNVICVIKWYFDNHMDSFFLQKL